MFGLQSEILYSVPSTFSYSAPQGHEATGMLAATAAPLLQGSVLMRLSPLSLLE